MHLSQWTVNLGKDKWRRSAKAFSPDTWKTCYANHGINFSNINKSDKNSKAKPRTDAIDAIKNVIIHLDKDNHLYVAVQESITTV